MNRDCYSFFLPKVLEPCKLITTIEIVLMERYYLMLSMQMLQCSILAFTSGGIYQLHMYIVIIVFVVYFKMFSGINSVK